MAMWGMISALARLRVLALALAIAALAIQSAHAAAHKTVSASLSARWSGKPIAWELQEFMADVSESAYNTALEAWLAAAPEPGPPSREECWEYTTRTLAHAAPAALQPLLGLQLATRHHSPRLEAFRHLAELSVPEDVARSHCCAALLDGALLLNAADAAKALRHAPPAATAVERVAFDHVYRHANSSSTNEGAAQPRTFTLYGPPGSPCFERMHRAVLQTLDEAGITDVDYVVRPVALQGCIKPPADDSDVGADACLWLGTETRPVLSGYGVQLAIKNMEYGQSDDAKRQGKDAAEDAAAAPGSAAGAMEDAPPDLRALLEKHDPEAKPLDLFATDDLSLQAAQLIQAASNPLATLAALTASFPALAHVVANETIHRKYRMDMQAEAQRISGADSALLVNGLSAVQVDMRDNLDLAWLQDVLLRDASQVQSLVAAGLHPQDAMRVLHLRAHDESERASVRVDLSGEASFWLNDLESDATYKDWSKDLKNLLNGGGMYDPPPQVGRNALNLQLIADPLSPQGAALADAGVQLYLQGNALRVGALFVWPGMGDDVSGTAFEDLPLQHQFVRYFLTVHKGFGRLAAWQLWYGIVQQRIDPERPEAPPKDISAALLRTTFESIWAQMQAQQSNPKAPRANAFGNETVADVLALLHGDGVPGVAPRWQEHLDFVRAKELTELSKAHFAFNGKLRPFEGSGQEVMHVQQDELQLLQLAVYRKEIDDDVEDCYRHFLDADGSIAAYSQHVLGRDSGSGPVADEDAPELGSGKAKQMLVIGQGDLRIDAPWVSALQYLHAPGTADDIKAVTHWVVLPASPEAARLTVLEAARFLASKQGESSRLAVLPCVAPAPAHTALAQVLLSAAALSGASGDKAVAFLASLAGDSELWGALAVQSSDAAGDGPITAALTLAEGAGVSAESVKSAMASLRTSEADQACSVLGGLVPASTTQPTVITNGRVVTFKGGAQHPSATDFGAAALVATGLQPGAKVLQILTEAREAGRTRVAGTPDGLSSKALSDLAMAAASTAVAVAPPDERPLSKALFRDTNLRNSVQLQELFAESPRLRSPRPEGSAEHPTGTLQVILDPVSPVAQRVAPLLKLLQDTAAVDVEIMLVPTQELEKMPLESYYAYAAPQRVGGAGGGALPLLAPPAARFGALPQNRVLTMNVDVPEPWLTEVTEAKLDTDNIKLRQLRDASELAIAMELEALLVTGTCIDFAATKHAELYPRGTQLTLGSPGGPAREDTVVMSNLGYFQLKAKPGRWDLGLAEGRSREMYEMLDAQAVERRLASNERNFTTAHGRPSQSVALHSLSGAHLLLPLRKRPEFAGQDVLEKVEAKGGWLAGKPERVEGDVINIFSIASGRMYERLQKIMMLSVLRHTKSKVKFWLIKNYMSPQMQEFMPKMAAKYGFEVELVTYKWPVWLHRQSEKQRLIWAYKILLLDVLFPLNVTRIIFCDSDQVIRTDMAELFHMDLEGKPLAYTPFCDDNKEMDGFRFWKSGFWERHLQGKPYHISALYVVDLAVFRQMAAGDRLRIVYNELSRDPKSLSNLDQDLPNYTQHQVPIYSLPQSWLWCESWCGNATKADAKTIDLCNNPMTKEPKVLAARRIVPEWQGYDTEVARLEKQLRSGAECDADGGDSASCSAEERTGKADPARAREAEAGGGPAHDEL